MTLETVEQLASEWASAGVAEGDLLLLHSNVGRTLRRMGRSVGRAGPQAVIESILKALGDSGTLLLPLFNFDFARGTPFDIRNTPSQMGAVTEVGRNWPGAVRTGHPIYSFAAIGAKAGLFTGLCNFSGYGRDSPFGVLHRHNGKIAVLDLPDQNSMTFYHYVEESFSVPYRYHKSFTGEYVDESGHASSRTFGLFVRDVERGVVTHVDPMGELLWKKNLYKGFRPGQECGLRVIPASAMFDEVTEILVRGEAKGLLYEIE